LSGPTHESGRRPSAIGSAGQGSWVETYRWPSTASPAVTSREERGAYAVSPYFVTCLTTAYSCPHSRQNANGNSSFSGADGTATWYFDVM